MTGKTHQIMDRPILSSFLMAMFVMVFHFVLTTVMAVPVSLLTGDNLDSDAYYIVRLIEPIVLLIAVDLLFTKVWFKDEFEGTLKGNIGYGFRIMLPAFVLEGLAILSVIIARNEIGSPHFVLKAMAESMAFVIVHALVYRSLILANLMRIKRTYRGMIEAAAISVFIFLAFYLTGSLDPDPVQMVYQTYISLCLAIFFIAVYLSCGSILPGIVYNFINELLYRLLTGEGAAGETTILSGETAGMIALCFDVLFNLFLLLVGIYLLRKKNFEKIRRVWDEKWFFIGS